MSLREQPPSWYLKSDRMLEVHLASLVADDTAPVSNPALYVSITSLLISGTTFWWTNRRFGRLVVLDGPAYALALLPDRVVLYLTLSFTNTGSRPWPVRDVRIDAPAISAIPMTWQATLKAIPGSEGDGGRTYPSGLVVGPQSTEVRVLEFQSGQPIASWGRTAFNAEVLLQPTRTSGAAYVRAAKLLIKADIGGEYGAIVPHGNADEPGDVGIVQRCRGLARPRAD